MGLLFQHRGVRLHKARAAGILRGVLGHQEQREVCQIRQEPDVHHYLWGLLHPGHQSRWDSASGTNTTNMSVRLRVNTTVRYARYVSRKSHKPSRCFSTSRCNFMDLNVSLLSLLFVATKEDAEMEPGNNAKVKYNSSHTPTMWTICFDTRSWNDTWINNVALLSVSQYVLILCNSIGTPLDSKYVDIGEFVRRMFCLLKCVKSYRPVEQAARL